MALADEAAGIWAELLAAEATNNANKAKGAIERGKLADINSRTPSNVGANPRATILAKVTSAFTKLRGI